ncbi:MAG: DUF6624 domain-containing protein [Saprospiraceae bacterium]
MKLVFTFVLFSLFACSSQTETKTEIKTSATSEQAIPNLIAMLDTVWRTEQEPIRLRDSLGKVFGYESQEFQKEQERYEKNHQVNEKKITDLLEKNGWPSEDLIGENGNLTICNVLQHSTMEVRLAYLPMMRAAVKNKKLPARLLARAEDRIATDRGELQIYGGQIKYYPETKTFNVWPIFDPVNVDKRRAAIGLEPMADFLKNRRFPMEWKLSEQLERTAAFQQKK